MILLLAHLARAADEPVSFSPWSGASIETTSSTTNFNVALTSPLGTDKNMTLYTSASVPLFSAASLTGTYSVSAKLQGTNAKKIEKAATDALFGDLSTAAILGGSSVALAVIDKQASKGADGKLTPAPYTDSKEVEDALQKAISSGDREEISRWRANIAAKLRDPTLTCNSGAPCSRTALADLDDLLAHAPGLAAEARMATSSPLDELAGGTLERSIVAFGLDLSYDYTTAATATSAAGLVEHGFDTGVELNGYIRLKKKNEEATGHGGFALSLAAGATPGWTLTDEGTPLGGGLFVGGGVAAVFPDWIHGPAGAGGKSGPRLYPLLQAQWREDFGLSADATPTGAGTVLLGIRPTGTGAGILVGAAFSQDETGLAATPTVTLSGEIPNLRQL